MGRIDFIIYAKKTFNPNSIGERGEGEIRRATQNLVKSARVHTKITLLSHQISLFDTANSHDKYIEIYTKKT